MRTTYNVCACTCCVLSKHSWCKTLRANSSAASSTLLAMRILTRDAIANAIIEVPVSTAVTLSRLRALEAFIALVARALKFVDADVAIGIKARDTFNRLLVSWV